MNQKNTNKYAIKETCDCADCGDSFPKEELRPKHYERELLVCENCYEADRNEDE